MVSVLMVFWDGDNVSAVDKGREEGGKGPIEIFPIEFFVVE